MNLARIKAWVRPTGSRAVSSSDSVDELDVELKLGNIEGSLPLYFAEYYMFGVGEFCVVSVCGGGLGQLWCECLKVEGWSFWIVCSNGIVKFWFEEMGC